MLAKSLIIAAAAIFIVKRLLNPVTDRAGQRIAEWLLPDERVWTYRLARFIARASGLTAPPRSPERSAAQGVLADIDEISLRGTGAARVAVRMACSVAPHAIVARLRWTPFAAVYAVLVYPTAVGLNVIYRSLGSQQSSELPRAPTGRFTCLLIVVSANVWVAYAVTVLLPTADLLGALLIVWSAFPIAYGDLNLFLAVGGVFRRVIDASHELKAQTGRRSARRD